MLTLPSPTIVHTRFNDNWLFVSFFYYCHYYFSLVFFYLVLFFIKWLYNDLLNFSFCKYISSHSTSIYSKLVLLSGALLFTLSVSLKKFLLVEIPGTKQWRTWWLWILLLKCVYVLHIKKKITLINSFTTNSGRFTEFYEWNVILHQIKSFFLDEPLIPFVIAGTALYWIDSSFWWNILLSCWLYIKLP